MSAGHLVGWDAEALLGDPALELDGEEAIVAGLHHPRGDAGMGLTEALTREMLSWRRAPHDLWHDGRLIARRGCCYRALSSGRTRRPWRP
jgi:hypothetical protein